MTNFQAGSSPSRLSWLTPERAVLVLPIAVGLVASVVLVSTVLTPLSLSVKDKNQQANDLRALRDELPLLQSQLEVAKNQLERGLSQQRDLLDLVAGVNELDTFLAELNELADQIGVTITRAQPGDVELYQPPAQSTDDDGDPSPPVVGGEGTVSTDPLLREGLERRSAEYEVSGSFAELLAFMRALENLQVFVEISDLALIQSAQNSIEDKAVDTPVLNLEITISAYGRQADDLND